jgi:hypothetical protein
VKTLRYATVIIACLALLFLVGSVGAYEAGHMTTPQLFARCGASLVLLWASLKISNRMQEKEKDE